MPDSMEEIVKDLAEVFSYSREVRPQDRAHAYLDRRQVQRGFSDTAMQCAALDMVRRAHALGEARATSMLDGMRGACASMMEASGELMGAAVELRREIDEAERG